MKIIFSILFILRSFGAFATTYYVSAEGSNQNDGLTMATALKSLGRVNLILKNLKPGDSLLFRRGDRFHGALTVLVSGSAQAPIVIGAYGSGPAPVINGLLSLNRWTETQAGIFETTLPAALTRPGVVLVNNKLQGIGRYPNANANNGGYLSYESHDGLNSITDKDLVNATNWTGAELVVRKNRWVIDKGRITRQDKNTFYYLSPTGLQPTDNFGYFIQNDIRTLDQPGEWYYDSASRKFQIFFGSASPEKFAVQASVIRSLFICHGQQYIVVENLAFEGANGKTFDVSDNANYLTIRGCRIAYSGEYAVNGNSLHHLTIDNCEIVNSLNNAIYVAPFTSATKIINNRITNTGLIAGMGANDNQALEAIIVHGQAPMIRNLIQGNRIDSTGYIPITFLGDSITVQQNFITNFCLVADDGGGIYSSGNFESQGRKVINNIVLDGKGSHAGTNQQENVAAHGIYMDDRTANVEITGNTVARCSEHGVFLHNASSILISGNTIYNCAGSQIGMREDSPDPIRKVTIRNNILFSGKESQLITDQSSRQDDLAQFGNFNENFIYHPSDVKPVARMYSPSAKNDLTLPSYQKAFGQETRSKKAAVVPSGNISFYYNAGLKDLPLMLKGKSKDLRGITYSGKIVLAPFSSAVLIKM